MRFGPYPDTQPLAPILPKLYQEGRFITTRYKGMCHRCFCIIPVGAQALYCPRSRLTFCTRCYPPLPAREPGASEPPPAG